MFLCKVLTHNSSNKCTVKITSTCDNPFTHAMCVLVSNLRRKNYVASRGIGCVEEVVNISYICVAPKGKSAAGLLNILT